MTTTAIDRQAKREQKLAMARAITAAQLRSRRLLSGKTIDRTVVSKTWDALVHRLPRSTGGGYCPCSGVTDFYTAEDRENWDDLHAYCVADELSG